MSSLSNPRPARSIQARAGQPIQPGPHKIQASARLHRVLDMGLIDEIQQVSNDDAIATAPGWRVEEGILCGISCGAAAAVALRLAAMPDHAGKTIVVVLPDPGRTLSVLGAVRGAVRRRVRGNPAALCVIPGHERRDEPGIALVMCFG